MTLKLYAVEIERTLMVLAESEQEAEVIAERNEREEMMNGAEYVSASPATERNIPQEWYGSHPYTDSNDCDKTVRQLLDEILEAERLRRPSVQELEAADQQRLVD